jgi:hypothetical protein
MEEQFAETKNVDQQVNKENPEEKQLELLVNNSDSSSIDFNEGCVRIGKIRSDSDDDSVSNFVPKPNKKIHQIIPETSSSTTPILDRSDRLKIYQDIVSDYNSCDFDQIYQLLKKNCDDNIAFHLKCGSLLSVSFHGMAYILAFYVLLHEYYPDSFVTNLTNRFSTVKSAVKSLNEREVECSTPLRPRVAVPSSNNDSTTCKGLINNVEIVEFVDKYVGGSMVAIPFEELCLKLFNSNLRSKDASSLSLSIVNLINDNLHPSSMLAAMEGSNEESKEKVKESSFVSSASVYESVKGKLFSFITETSLTFNLNTNKINEWKYDVLASHSSDF